MGPRLQNVDMLLIFHTERALSEAEDMGLKEPIIFDAQSSFWAARELCNLQTRADKLLTSALASTGMMPT